MKSEIFSKAIHFRNMIRFFYFLDEVIIEPYLISCAKTGKKYLYGRLPSSNQVKRFEFSAITNIRVLRDRKFSPVIPIRSQVN
jgi:hypothetical protein